MWGSARYTGCMANDSNVSLSVIVPKWLHEQIRASAHENQRTIAGEIRFRLTSGPSVQHGHNPRGRK